MDYSSSAPEEGEEKAKTDSVLRAPSRGSARRALGLMTPEWKDSRLMGGALASPTRAPAATMRGRLTPARNCVQSIQDTHGEDMPILSPLQVQYCTFGSILGQEISGDSQTEICLKNRFQCTQKPRASLSSRHKTPKC